MLLVAGVVFAALAGTDLFMTALAILNRRHEERVLPGEREWVEQRLGVEDVDELLDYQRATTGTALLRSWVLLAGVLLVLYGGLYGDLVRALGSTGLPPLARGVILVAGALLAYRLVAVPFDLFETFVVEETFGFNNQTPALWLRDLVVGTAVTLVIALPVSAVLFWFVGATPLWWLAGWALAVALLVGLQVLLPRVVYPLFYEFAPLEEGDLRRAVEAVFDRAGFTCEQVYEMDASRRSSHTNAFFVGFGPAKRVVLYDTLIEGMAPAEVQGVLAHELAHWKKGHIWKFVALGALQFLVIFAALGALVAWTPLYATFGMPPDATEAGALLAFVVVGQVYQLTAPLSNLLSLRFERQADRFAVETVGSEPMAGALSNLAAENLAELFPHPWYERFHYDHPPIPERIRYVREWGESGVGPGTDGTGGGPQDAAGSAGSAD
ncbi:MAG: M48 family metallopeptidase [Haloarculaceae archaeon]